MTTLQKTLRVLGLLCFCALAFGALQWLFMWSEGQGTGQRWPARLAILGLYALLIGVPFLPSFNLSMAFMLLQGPDQIWWVYGATVLGFSLPFLAGRLIPHRYLMTFFDRVGMHRVSALIKDTQAQPLDSRLQLIKELSPRWMKSWVDKWRYVAFWVALNFPGNVVVGGAGGLLLVAGLSRLFAPVFIFVIIGISLCVIPLIITFTGFDILEWFSQ